MKKIAWVTDSTASFTQEETSWLQSKHIYVVAMGVSFGDVTYREGIDLTTEEFYEKMGESKESPKSSQPALGDFVSLYERLNDTYDEAIVVHVSGKLSGTYSSSVQAAEMVGFPIHSVDSWIGSFPLKFMIQTGVDLLEKGEEPSSIVRELKKIREKCRLLLLPLSLDQLRKSGRVSNFSLLLGNVLQIKPILGFKEGKVLVEEKVRTLKKAEKVVFERFEKSVVKGIHEKVAVLYAGEHDVSNGFLQTLKERYKELKVDVMPLIPVAGVHTGLGTVALAWIEK